MNSLRLILLFLFALLLSSCIESREEITINADGSGSAKISLSMPNSLVKRIGSMEQLEKTARELDAQMDHLTIESLTFESVDGQFFIKALASSDDLRKLQEEIAALPEGSLPPDSPQMALLGELAIQLKGLTIHFEREVKLADLFKDTPVANNPGFLGETSFTYLINLPTEAKTHNAHLVQNDGKTLVWRYLAKDEMARPLKMSFSAPVLIPAWVIGLVMGVLVALLVLIGYCFYRWKVRKSG